ncbi:hypothetical protein BOTBODRAFT_305633 [Botryobasidium botryosum FD-172 SS1]|uniref:Uncharacterized protein n=1 Tax=Botryobasidium botryosum (strain FD-172 SS1) TaxID=930990 RepID=A0A067N8F9_BOTB1|nr:hypothetical protein BOTBODRAFT_305633 [Botryobasidium botryosum FD-172 SS1]
MLIQNIVQGKLVNGSTGIIVDFLTLEEVGEDVYVPEYAEKAAYEFLGASRNDNVGTQVSDMNPPSGIDEDISMEDAMENDSANSSQDTDIQHPPNNQPIFISRKWPVVDFEPFGKVFLPPLNFSVVNVFGGLEALRIQVRISSSDDKISSCTVNPLRPGSPHPCLGNFYSQEPGPNFVQGKSRPGQSVRKGTSVRRAIPSPDSSWATSDKLQSGKSYGPPASSCVVQDAEICYRSKFRRA